MENIHRHSIGIEKPLKRNLLYKCVPCLPNKMFKVPHKRIAKHKLKKKQIDKKVEPDLGPQAKGDPANMDEIDIFKGVAGQYFHMNF